MSRHNQMINFLEPSQNPQESRKNTLGIKCTINIFLQVFPETIFAPTNIYNYTRVTFKTGVEMHVSIHANFRYVYFISYKILIHRYILMNASNIELRKYLSKILATDNRSKSDGEHKTSTQAIINAAQIRPRNCVSSVYKTYK
jgi:hypothetical protein